MDVSYLGNLIRFHRQHAGLTQKELAELSGVGKTVVFDLEKGKETIQLNTALSILAALNMDFRVDGPLVERYNRITE